MADKDVLHLVIPPEVDGAISIDLEIDALRRGITTDCAALLKEARGIEATPHGKAFHLKLWEEMMAGIKREQATTFSIQRLKELKQECNAISRQLHRFRQ